MRYIIPSSAALTAPTFTGFVDATRARRVGVAAAMGGVSAFSLRARSSDSLCTRESFAANFAPEHILFLTLR